MKEKRERKASARSRADQEHLHAVCEDEAWKEASARRRHLDAIYEAKLPWKTCMVGGRPRPRHLRVIYDMKPRSCVAESFTLTNVSTLDRQPTLGGHAWLDVFTLSVQPTLEDATA